MWRLSSVLVTALLVSQCAAQNVDVRFLQDLVPFYPRGQFRGHFEFDNLEGITFQGETLDHSEEIANLEKSLQGNLDDAERYFRLCLLYPSVEKSKNAGTRALELARRRHAIQPNDSNNIYRLGRTLILKGEFTEAEPLIRQAVKMAPKDSERWIDLGYCLYRIAGLSLVGGNKSADSGGSKLAQYLYVHPPGDETLAAARSMTMEAAKCYNQAVQLTPNSPNPYYQRAIFQFARTFQEYAIRVSLGEMPDPQIEFQKYIDEDWQTIATLDPENPRALGMAIFCLYMRHVFDGKDRNDIFEIPIRFSPKMKQIVDHRLSQIERLTTHRVDRIAADAQYVRAFHYYLLDKNFSRATSLLRKSLEFRPGHVPSLELLQVCFCDGGEWKELLAHTEKRLRTENNASIRLEAARADFELGQFESSERHLRIALKLHSKDLACNLALAAVLLKRFDKSLTDEIRECLFQAELQCPEGKSDVRTTTTILRCISSALAGDVEFARRTVEELIENEPKNQNAQNLAKALRNK